MNTEAPQIYTQHYFLTAGECNPEGRMPLPLLMSRIIEVATEHANLLDIGYAQLIEMNLAWVLSRVTIVIDHMPGVNANYSISTWIESTNRLFSDRALHVTDGDGSTIAYVRTTWAAIDLTTRRAANPSIFGDIMFPANPPACPVPPAPRRIVVADDAESHTHSFGYCDLDVNRHVNTVRYVELILNHWPLDWFDSRNIARFDITFHHECHFGDEVDINISTDVDGVSSCEIVHDGTRAVGAQIVWTDKENQIIN